MLKVKHLNLRDPVIAKFRMTDSTTGNSEKDLKTTSSLSRKMLKSTSNACNV